MEVKGVEEQKEKKRGGGERSERQGKGSERNKNMGIWKGLRGKAEGYSGDQVIKTLSPTLRSSDLNWDNQKSQKVLSSRILTLKGCFSIQYVKHILEGSQKEQSRDYWVI